MDNHLGIAPPSAEVVAHTKGLCQQLAQANAAVLTGAAMVAMAEQAMGSFALPMRGQPSRVIRSSAINAFCTWRATLSSCRWLRC